MTEFILVSDVLGVSTLIDTIQNLKPTAATESTVLGPFYTEDTHEGQHMLVVVRSEFITPRSCQRRVHCIGRQGRLHVCRRTRIGHPRKSN